MVSITFLLNSALSCNKRWLESLPTFFLPKFGISCGVPGIWKRKLQLPNLAVEQYKKLNND